MSIRPATLGDAPLIAALWNGMIRDTLATFTTEEKTNASIAELIMTRPDGFWVAGTREVQGFVTFGAFRSGPGYAATVEHSIILDAGARGQGLGRALLQHAMDAAATQGCHVMVAGISGANPGAVAFHQKMGFAHVGRLPDVGRKSGQWLDLILMQKTLSAT